MTDKAKLAEQQARGADAAHILDHPLVKEALDGMRAEVMAVWENSKIDEDDVREDCFKMKQAIECLERCFRAWIRSGDAAGKELLKLKDEKPKV